MSKHPTKVNAYDGSLKDLARSVADLRYDALQEFLRALRVELQRDADADEGRNRLRLARRLRAASHALGSAELEISDAWQICRKHEDASKDVAATGLVRGPGDEGRSG